MSEGADGLAPNATVVRKELLAGCLFRLWVRPDWRIEEAAWEPGQFVRLAAPHPGSDFRKEGRAYSFVGANDGVFEFYVVKLEAGLQTPRLFALSEGDRLWCEAKINGHFTLSHNPPGRELWMVGTGAGVAPLICVIRHGDLARYERVVVVHQVRERDHLVYGAELAAWANADGRRYVPIVSRPGGRLVVKDGHAALFGRVGDRVRDGRLEKAAETTFGADRSVVMLCGNPDMLADVRAALEERGLARHLKRKPGQIVTERYW